MKMIRQSHPSWLRLAILAALAWHGRSALAANSEADRKFFEAQVRPLLIEQCLKCHGEAKQKGGLRLDSREAALKGGKHGPAIVPGHQADSLTIRAVRRTDSKLKMPPESPLRDGQVETLVRWIDDGAVWPEAATPLSPAGKHHTITDADRAFWSFQPVKDPPDPAVSNTQWPRNAIDRFVLSRLESEKLAPADEADRRQLIRRLTFDLHGLPPTPAEVEAFVADPSPGAYPNLVDRLLASPRYGEHWARHWLDLARYSESDGYKQDAYRPNAWPYRDYVIKSLNDDKPYNRFITEQLAGDEIAPDDAGVLVATGFLRAGIYEYNQADVRRQLADISNEVTDATGDVFLGLSMGCARCHDHKFDPILQSDYFQLQAFFTPMVQRHDLLLATPAKQAAYRTALAPWEDQARQLRQQIAVIEKPFFDKQAEDAIGKFPLDIRALFHKPAAERTLLEEQLVRLGQRQVVEKTEVLDVKLSKEAKQEYDRLRAELKALEKSKPASPLMAFVATDIGPQSPPTVIPGTSGTTLEPGYLSVLSNSPLTNFVPAPSATSTGRRTALARWITQPGNPLTARVAVNRIWQQHFGRGLVATSSDFGRLGERPSHPELLDWLSSRFVESGWSMKAMHRLILNSAAYRQTALRETPELAARIDPDNRLLWKMNVRRLEAEQIRDSMLVSSGEMSMSAGGPSDDPAGPRRSIYTRQKRNSRDPLLDAFDLPDSFGSLPVRNHTTTATQSLLLVNGQWPLERAKAFAARLRAQAKDAGPEATVELAYRTALGRPPTDSERREAMSFLLAADETRGDEKLADVSPQQGLVDFCHVLLNSNAFLYVD